MNDYMALRVDMTPCNEDMTDLAAAFLAEAGYESFEPDAKGLTAYIPAGSYSAEEAENALTELPFETDLKLTATFVEGKDWNEEWEKNYFQPIVVGNKCVIHSTFHKDVPLAEFDIVIDPKMAFGTGHHFTTRLMLGYLLDADLRSKSLIDMGTGTGILAILAAMKGAKPVSAVEIDEPAWENALEHAKMNKVDLDIRLGDASQLADLPQADFFLANINRNVILNDIESYVAKMKPGAKLILSGFFQQDIPIIRAAAEAQGLTLAEERTEVSPLNGDIWAALLFIK